MIELMILGENMTKLIQNKDESVHRFTQRVELLERERERQRKREKKVVEIFC